MNLARIFRRLFIGSQVIKAPTPIICGYTIREGDANTEMDIESLILRRVIPYKLKPNNTVIWARYSNHSFKKADFSAFIYYPELTKEEEEEIELALKPYKEENKVAEDEERKRKEYYREYHGYHPMTTGNAYAITSGLMYYKNPIDQIRKELVNKIKNKNRDWLPELYREYKKSLMKKRYV